MGQLKCFDNFETVHFDFGLFSFIAIKNYSSKLTNLNKKYEIIH